MKKLYKALTLLMALAIIFSFPISASAAGTDSAAIDYTKTASLSLYKYDLTGAANDGVWNSSSFVSSGAYDQSVIDAMANYAVEGVVFSYLRLADISILELEENGEHTTVTAFGFEENESSLAVLSAVGLSYDDAYYSENSIHYFLADTLNASLASALSTNSTTVKNSLESLVSTTGTAMTETDEYGHSEAEGLELGLYLVVESLIPENVTATCDPFLVSMPMTSADGDAWNYELTVYPKNTTGMPTLSKGVRESAADTGKSAEYSESATASIGDGLDYAIVSTLPTITSEVSYLSLYSFTDSLAKSMSYNKDDVIIEFYEDAACTELISSWKQDSGKFSVSYNELSNGTSMIIDMTEAGLSEINTATAVYGSDSINSGYSDCTMRILYSCTLKSDHTAVLGDKGNPNTVELIWKRSNTEYSDKLNAAATVHTYAIDLTKKFSDGEGDLNNVKFLLKNDTDNYYVKAAFSNGIYTVTGHVDEAEATTFIPTADGKIYISGIEADSYFAIETATDEGYSLLMDKVRLDISVSEGSASAQINRKDAPMKEDNGSANAVLPLTVVNTKGFTLPQTGSYGTWMFTVCGVLAMGIAVYIIWKLYRKEKSV